MSAIGPGDWVECFRALPSTEAPGVGDFWQMTPLPAVGALYHVEEILPGSMFSDGLPALVFTNVPGRYPDGQRFAYAADRFRPIYRPKSTFIDSLKQPAPDRELEDV